jgi:hypothetical protein
MSKEEDFVEALSGFAESTRDAIGSIGAALERQDEAIEGLAALLGKVVAWTESAQTSILALSERITQVERKSGG